MLLLNIINFIDRNLLLGYAKDIQTDLDLNYTQWGLLTGFVFTLLYTFGGLVFGAIADRWNRPRLIASGLFVWSVMTAVTGATRNFAQIIAPRLLIGAGEATLTPAAMSMLSDVYPASRRAFASGIYYIGVPVGTGLGFILAGVLREPLGWRNSFYVMGGIGVALCIFVLLMKDPPRGGGEATDANKEVKLHGSFGALLADFFSFLLKSPALMFTVIGSVLTHAGLGSTFHDQVWLVEERGFDPAKAAGVVGLYFLLAGALGTALGGVIGDLFKKRWESGRLIFLVVAIIVMAPLAISYRFLPKEHPLFYVTLFVGCLMLTYFYGSVFSTVQDLVPVRVRATSVAFLLFASNFIGIAGGSYLAGALSDYFQELGWAEPLTWGIFIPNIMGTAAVIFYILAAMTYGKSMKLLAENE